MKHRQGGREGIIDRVGSGNKRSRRLPVDKLFSPTRRQRLRSWFSSRSIRLSRRLVNKSSWPRGEDKKEKKNARRMVVFQPAGHSCRCYSPQLLLIGLENPRAETSRQHPIKEHPRRSIAILPSSFSARARPPRARPRALCRFGPWFHQALDNEQRWLAY